MNAYASPAKGTRTHPGTSGEIPAISLTGIDSFHEVSGLWEKNDLLVFLADLQSCDFNYPENLDCREFFQKNRYVTQYARHRYSVSRTLTKLLLAAILEIESPGNITLEKEPAGGIRVAGDDSVFLCLSYAQNNLALAIARSKVGIDIEHIRPIAVRHIPSIASTICGVGTGEPHDDVAFLRHWTAVEALAKFSDIPLWKVLQQPRHPIHGYSRSFILPGRVMLSLVTEAPCPPDRMRCVAIMKKKEDNQV